MENNLYPITPILDNYDFIEPTKEFKKSTSLVVRSIAAFSAFYLTLVGLSIALLVGCGYTGLYLILVTPGILTMVLGAGIIGIGVMVFLFLIKSLFLKTRDKDPYRIELKEKDHPELFKFIKQLAQDVGTDFPKKVFVSPYVNACVFYDSSFWSMFFPVRKNLEIGLGLVNSLNISEMKAVIAHEFGHFSQKSMKMGSYVYTVNRVIYNMVNEYDSWDEALARWEETGGIFGFFAKVTNFLVGGVRSLMKRAYSIVNKNYMKLSRQMEYNADLIAASVTGNQFLVDSLRKTDFTSFAYSYTSKQLEELVDKEKSSTNLYKNHDFSVSHLARKNDLKIVDGELKITTEDLEKNIVQSRVNFKNQWASHPSLKQREENLLGLNIPVDTVKESAWKLFTNPEGLQEKMTKLMYKLGFQNKKLKGLKEGEFEDYILNEEKKYKIPQEFNDYYSYRKIDKFNPRRLLSKDLENLDFSFIYSKGNIEVIKRYNSNVDDLEVLNQIKDGHIKTKYFEFDNLKYHRREVNDLIDSLDKEIAEEEKLLKELDHRAFISCHNKAKESDLEKELIEKYDKYFDFQEAVKEIADIYIKIRNFSYYLYSERRMSEERFDAYLFELEKMERELKNFLGNHKPKKIKKHFSSEKVKEGFLEYAKEDDVIFIIPGQFNPEQYVLLGNLAGEVYGAINTLYYLSLKDLAEFKLSIFKPGIKEE